MTTAPARDVLNRLGMTGLAVSETDRLSWAAAGESHARGAVPAVALAFSTLAASGFVDVPFASVAAPALGRLDAAVSSPGTHVMRLSAPRGHAVHVRVPEGWRAEDVAYLPDEDPGTVYVDLSAAPAVLVRGGADVVVLTADERGVVVTGVSRNVDAMAALEQPPVLGAWLAACEDVWLAEQVEPLSAAGDPWTAVVAAGMLGRLVAPGSPAQARVWLDAARRGDASESVRGPRRWAAALTGADVSRVEAQVLAEAAGLALDVEDAVADADARAEGWEDTVRELAHRRDDLEGVLLLLDAAGAAAATRAALAAVDREGLVLRLAIGDEALEDDERLRRAGLKDPDAWWAAHAG
jgi:hypothetical protein